MRLLNRCFIHKAIHHAKPTPLMETKLMMLFTTTRKSLSTLLFLSATVLSACGGGSSSDDGNTDNGEENTGNGNQTPINNGSALWPTVAPGTREIPRLALVGNNPQRTIVGSTFTDLGATASDNTDGNLTEVITESNNVNTSKAGCYQQTYLVSDSDGNSNTITRTIFVGTEAERHAPNTVPITQEISVTNVFSESSTINVLGSAFDADCDPLTVSQVSTPDTGTATINTDGTITYNSQGNVGSHFFTYTVTDGYGGSSTSGVTIASIDPNDGNDNWPAVNGETVSTPKNTAILIDVLANDSDPDGDTLVLDKVDAPQYGSTEKQDGKVYYTPNPDFVGEDYFYYGVHDGHGHNGSAMTKITVTE